MTLAVLFADNHLLVVAKPAGVPVVPDESGDASLLDLVKEWVVRESGKTGEAYLGVVHRLDRPVSGVLLFARTSKAASRLSAQFRRGGVRKLYWGVSEGVPDGDGGVVEQWLLKDTERRRVRAVGAGTRGARLAVTRWRVAAREGARTHLDLEPRTGRPHQLRAAAAALGCPLLGDLKYGAPRALPDKSIALHAAELEVVHPTLREPVVLRCPPPDREWWSLRRARGSEG